MKAYCYQAIVLALVFVSPSQSTLGQAKLEVTSLDGGSVATPLSYGIVVNKESSLHRQWFVINDPSCPMSLAEAGITTKYGKDDYSFNPAGKITATEAVSAFEVRFMVFDVWGNHMKTLSVTVLRDIPAGSPLQLAPVGSWRAWETEVSEYLTSVGFVGHVRTSAGRAWSADTRAVLKEIETVKLKLTQEQLEAPKPKEK